MAVTNDNDVSGVGAVDTGITQLTGDVTTSSGSGSQAATIAADAVTNAKLANMAANTIKGNNTGGAENPVDLTATQATAMLNAVVGDSGSGGTKGLVPAPATGDAAAAKFLKADGTWAVPAGGGGLDAIKVDASEFIPRTTNGCGINSTESSSNKVNRDLLLFDSAAIEYAQYWFNWPTGWATAKVTFYWSASTGTGSVVWGAAMKVYTDGDAVDSAVGTAIEVTDAAASADTLRQSAATAAITPAGTITAGKRTVIEIYRDPTDGSDDMAVDALLEGVLIEKNS